jgi:dihydroorotate dehydrogenase
MYKIIRIFLFLFDAEKVHYLSMNCLRFLCRIPLAKRLISNKFSSKNPGLQTNFLGLHLKNPVGLGAGFDKNASYLNELEALGFGFIEIGTVTPKPQAGNDKPRLFRLPVDKAIINRMGFNNDGVEAIAQRLRQWTEGKGGNNNTGLNQNRLIIGGNIGKNKVTPNDQAWEDYAICFEALYPYVDYFVVNVSSPNTPGLRELQEKESLRKILTNLQLLNKKKSNANKVDRDKPILLKIAPDLALEQIDDVIDLALEIKLDGLVATNTTIERSQLKSLNSKLQMIGAGGLSGSPLRKRSTEIVQYICKRTNGLVPVIASGGIFCAADAKEKFDAGASLIQVWTGFIYEGPAIVKNICDQLKNLHLHKKDEMPTA